MNKKGFLGFLFGMLFVIIIGGLILHWLTSDNKSSEATNEIKYQLTTTDNRTLSGKKLIEISPAQALAEEASKTFPEDSPYVQGILSNPYKCSTLKIYESEISNYRGIVCEEICGKKGLNYHSYQCDKDILSCYCIND